MTARLGWSGLIAAIVLLVVGVIAGAALSGVYHFSAHTVRSDHQAFVTLKGSNTTSSKRFTDVLARIARPAISNKVQ